MAPVQVELLKSQLAPLCTMENKCSADFSECVPPAQNPSFLERLIDCDHTGTAPLTSPSSPYSTHSNSKGKRGTISNSPTHSHCVGEFSEGGGGGGGGSKGKRNTEVERLQQQWGEKEEEEVVHIGSKGQDKIVATIQMQGVKKSVKAAVGWQQTVRFFLFCSITHTRHTSTLSLSLSVSSSLSHTRTHTVW